MGVGCGELKIGILKKMCNIRSLAWLTTISHKIKDNTDMKRGGIKANYDTALPSISWVGALMAWSAAAWSAKVTKPKPLDLPVVLSYNFELNASLILLKQAICIPKSHGHQSLVHT